MRGQRPDYHALGASPGCSEGNFTARAIIPFQQRDSLSTHVTATFLLHHKLCSILPQFAGDFNGKERMRARGRGGWLAVAVGRGLPTGSTLTRPGGLNRFWKVQFTSPFLVFFRFLTAKRALMEAPALPKIFHSSRPLGAISDSRPEKAAAPRIQSICCGAYLLQQPPHHSNSLSDNPSGYTFP